MIKKPKRKIVVFAGDPIKAYYKKGEIKARYYNPGNFFDEVHIFSPCDEDIEAEKVQMLAGEARLKIYPLKKGLPQMMPWVMMQWLFFLHRRKVLKLIQEISPSMVRGFGLTYNSYLAVYCAQKLGIPSVVSVHSDEDKWRNLKTLGFDYLRFFPLDIPYFLFLERYILKHADLIIGAYKYTLKHVTRYRKKGVELIYNKVYSSQYDLSQRRDNEKPLIISVGRHIKAKSPENIIRAIKNLDVNLMLIGTGYLTPKMKRLVADLGISDKVRFIESVPNSQIHQYYLRSDIFALSLTLGGVAIPEIEAMAAALPIVVSKTQWEEEPELVGDIAIVVENTPEGFEEAFRRLLSDPQLRRELGKKAKKRALEIDGETMEKKEVDLYRSLLEKA